MSEPDTTAQPGVTRRLLWFWLPPLAWMGMIFYLSAQPDLPGPPEPWLATLLSNSAHFGVYAGLAFWWWRALWNSRRDPGSQEVWERGKREGAVLLLALGISVLYGASDEFHQSFVPGRDASVLDWLVDTAGAATALWLVWRRRGGSEPI